MDMARWHKAPAAPQMELHTHTASGPFPALTGLWGLVHLRHLITFYFTVESYRLFKAGTGIKTHLLH